MKYLKKLIIYTAIDWNSTKIQNTPDLTFKMH